VARKRVAPLTPIKPKWHARPQFAPVKGAGLRQTSKQHFKSCEQKNNTNCIK
jgi:hypothetical protein